MNRAELWNFLREVHGPFGSRRAISTSQADITFENLYKIADQLALDLARSGVGRGDLIALSLPNSLAFVPAFLALVKLSAVIALVSPLYRASELKTIMDGVHPRFFLVSPKLAGTWMPVIEPARTETIVIPGMGEIVLAIRFPPTVSSPTSITDESDILSSDRAALIKFSSGSTGIPKGVLLTVDNLLAEAKNVITTLALTPTDRIYAPVPIFHSYGFDLGVLPMLTAGTTLSLQETFVPRRVLADLASGDVTVFLGVPSMYRTFIETPLSVVQDLSHIRYLLSCTAPLPPNLIAAFQEKFRMPICQHYGSSETGAATTHVPSQVLTHPTSVGLPMKNVQITIRDDFGVEVPIGGEGEVVVKSQVVASGYVMGHPTGDSKFVDGTYRTGDIGFVDQDGFLYLHGRMDDMINVGGLKVSPSEVVQVLESFPAVDEAAVIGIKNDAGEEFVYAVVTLKHPATEKEMIHHCRSRLSEYKIPRRIDIRGEMPRGASGKIKLNPKDLQL